MKNSIVIFGLVIVLFLFVAGCQQPETSPQTQPNTPPQQNQTTTPPVTPPVLPPPTCEEWAKSMVPETFTVHEGVGSCERSLSGLWNDDEYLRLIGRNVEFTNNKNRKFVIELGEEIGEDPARYYIKAFNGDVASLVYEKSVRTSQNTLLGLDKFQVNANGYKRIESSVRDAEGIGCLYYDYMIDDYTISGCEKVSQ